MSKVIQSKVSQPKATEPSLQISAEVTRRIRQHARSSMTTEVCGVLIGDLRPNVSEDAVDIFACIAAVNAAQAGTHVTFTQDAWEHIYKIKDVEYPDARIVGWYHSHPGFGVFLSEHDTFIQENFFSAANQVAWVFDPHTDEEGCFGWVDGKITRLQAIGIVDHDTPANVSESRELTVSGDPDEATDEGYEDIPTRSKRVPSWLRWAAVSSSLLATLILGFAISHLLFPALYPIVLPMNPLDGQPMLRDPQSGGPVYMDPQSGKYIVLDPHTGKLIPVDPKSLRTAQPPALPELQGTPGQPVASPAPTTPPPAKEKK